MQTLRYFFWKIFIQPHRFTVKCAHCGTINSVSSDGLKNNGNGCDECKLPLNWSIPKGTYIPNFVPFSRRLKYLTVAIALMSVFGIALLENSLYVPYFSKKAAVVVHFSGYGLVIPLLGALSGVVVAVAVFLDHFDVRNNEAIYKKIQSTGALIGVLCYILSAFLADGGIRLV